MQKENEYGGPARARVISFRSAESDEEGAEDGLRSTIRLRAGQLTITYPRHSNPGAIDNGCANGNLVTVLCLRG